MMEKTLEKDIITKSRIGSLGYRTLFGTLIGEQYEEASGKVFLIKELIKEKGSLYLNVEYKGQKEESKVPLKEHLNDKYIESRKKMSYNKKEMSPIEEILFNAEIKNNKSTSKWYDDAVEFISSNFPIN